MLTSKLSHAEIEVLNYERFHYPCAMIQKRLHAVYLKHVVGGSDAAIGLMCDPHFNSVSHWVKVYDSEGIWSVLVNNYGTNKSELATHSMSILEDFKQLAPVSSNEAVSRIKDLTGVSRSPTQVRNWMHKNGLEFRKMGHLPAKMDSDRRRG